MSDHLSRGCTLNAYNDYNDIIVCIVHAHVTFNIAYNIIMPNIQPPPPQIVVVVVIITVVDVVYVYIISALPNQSSYLCMCVWERSIAIRTLHTRQFIIIITVRIRFLFICFFSVVVLFSFLIRTAVDNNSTTFTRSFEWKIGPSGNGGGRVYLYIYIFILSYTILSYVCVCVCITYIILYVHNMY